MYAKRLLLLVACCLIATARAESATSVPASAASPEEYSAFLAGLRTEMFVDIEAGLPGLGLQLRREGTTTATATRTSCCRGEPARDTS